MSATGRMRWSPVSPPRRLTRASRTRRGCTTPTWAAMTTTRSTGRRSGQILRAFPEVRAIALANRAFLQRAVRFLAGEAGIRQFIDIGTGIPSAGNVHEVAGQAAPDARVVYVDNDPIVHVHANALLTGTGTTSIVLADLRDPGAILAHPEAARADRLHPSRSPCCSSRSCTSSRTRRTRPGSWPRCGTRSPPGSYLVLSHGTPDFHPPGDAGQAAAAYKNATAPLVLAPLRAGLGVLRRVRPGGAGRWCRPRCGARTASGPARGTWRRSASTPASAARPSPAADRGLAGARRARACS